MFGDCAGGPFSMFPGISACGCRSFDGLVVESLVARVEFSVRGRVGGVLRPVGSWRSICAASGLRLGAFVGNAGGMGGSGVRVG